MWRGGALLQPRQALEAGDVAVAIDRHEIALAEQDIRAGAFAAGEFGDRIVRLYQEARQLAAQIGLTRRQPDERLAALAAITEAERAGTGFRPHCRRLSVR